MPLYQTQCQKCKNAGDVRMSFADYDSIKAGEKCLVCNGCAGKCEILFDPSSVQFVLKDGESGGWMSKALKENAYRSRRRGEMARREKDHVFKPKLQPNYKGVETGTWREAQHVASSEAVKQHGKDFGEAVAKTYEPLVTKKGSAE